MGPSSLGRRRLLAVFWLAAAIWAAARLTYLRLSPARFLSVVSFVAALSIMGARWLYGASVRVGEKTRAVSTGNVVTFALAGLLFSMSMLVQSLWVDGVHAPHRIVLFAGFVFIVVITVRHVIKAFTSRKAEH
jgi:hypothetical protein